MTVEDLEFAIGDAQRFIDRATSIKAKYPKPGTGEIIEADAKTICRLSMDVTRALQDLRKDDKPK